MSRALTQAFARALELQRKSSVRPVVLPREVVRHGVARRAAADAPLNVRPIVILAPVADTAQTVHDFALEQFPVQAQRLAR